MRKKFSNSAHLSQIETSEACSRVILLGASNLSMSFPMVIETARALFDRPTEFFVAMGLGRSYGQESKFFGKKFSGILQSDLWDALDRARPLPTFAIVADVGNDLAYEAPVASIVTWVEQTLDRLAAQGARCALNNVPLASLERVGGVRYRLMRSLLFPKCGVPRREMLHRATELSRALEEVAAERKTPAFSGESAWYGWDPIHPRGRWRGAIWERMFAALAPTEAPATMRRPSRAAARRWRRLQARGWASRGGKSPGAAAVERLDDGTMAALF
jgi:hypothetical protein